MGSRSSIGVLAAALVIVAGCSSGPSAGAVTWTNDVCGALTGFARSAAAQPKINKDDPAGAVRLLSTYFSSTAAALQDAITGLDSAGPAPVTGGDDFVGRLKTTLTSIHSSFTDAGTRLSGVDSSSPEALAAALPAVVAPLQSLSSLADPTRGLESNDALRAAAEQAPNCKQLRSK
ncbi:hypothetical protein [Pseudonocardia sp. GCM10023141]|uniref:hypothetical protein n=1 Tax=Pseudonocardia sp. GCM10023141 TaxID=3252653 RepID=UPI003607338B